MVIASLESSLFNLISQWYTSTGYLGIILAMALESCCIPLPSEIVMPLAGFFVATSAATATGRLSLVGVTIAGTIGCLIGSAVAYGIGATGGRPLLLKYGKYILISQSDSDRADRWFASYGSPVAFFSRLLPVIRTYISLPAGISRMNFGKFLLYTLLGSLPWTFALAYVGYQFGPALQQKISELSSIFHGLDALIIGLFVLAVALYVYRHLQRDRRATEATQRSQPAQSTKVAQLGQPQRWGAAYQAQQDPSAQQAPQWQQPSQPSQMSQGQVGQGQMSQGQVGQGGWPVQEWGQAGRQAQWRPNAQPYGQFSGQPSGQPSGQRPPAPQSVPQQAPQQTQRPPWSVGDDLDPVDQPTMPHHKI